MKKEELYEKLEQMVEMLGETEVIEALAMAMDLKELQENLEYIDRMNDLDLF